MKVLLVFLICLAWAAAEAQVDTFRFSPPLSDASLSDVMPSLAQWVVEKYRDDNRDRYLSNMFRAQIVAQQYRQAIDTIHKLRGLRAAMPVQISGPSVKIINSNLQYEVLALASLRQVQEYSSFETAVRKTVRAAQAGLDNEQAAAFSDFMTVVKYPDDVRPRLLHALEHQAGKSTISLPDAVELVDAYQMDQAYRTLSALTPELIAEDDQKRYIVDNGVLVPASDGAQICAIIYRPRELTGPLPALLNFSIYADLDRKESEARYSASRGYVGVSGFTRGKACSPTPPIPIEHDGSDAAMLIDWISRQPWSDKRVGMFGGSYDGFTQWAAAKEFPKALKSIMPSVAFAPGIDFPQPYGIFQNYGYPWPFYTTDNKNLDDSTYFDAGRWDRLNRDWYVAGRPYRDLEKIDGKANPIWDGWLRHPAYDAYWQRTGPVGKDFSRISIPVLTTTGYYDDGQVGALHYFQEHYEHRPMAEHYLVVGPFNHVSGQVGTVSALGSPVTALRDYQLDTAARLDIYELRYQWFDYIFKGAPKPAILQDRVNYEVMGANVWEHAPSIDRMASERRKFFLSAVVSEGEYRLQSELPPKPFSIRQSLDLADRSDVDDYSTAGDNDTWNSIEHLTSNRLETRHALVLTSEPFANTTEISGLFSGHLDFIATKRDFDFNIQLYELTPNGEYIQLSFYSARASLVRNRSVRHLLRPGLRESLDFTNSLLTSRLFAAGSRVVIVLSLMKQPNLQIDYGTGKDVSDETIADAKAPLEIQWLRGTFMALPCRRDTIASGSGVHGDVRSIGRGQGFQARSR